MSQDPSQDPAGPEATSGPQPAAPTPDPGQLAVVFHRVRGMGQRMEALAERLEQIEQRAIAAGSAGEDGKPAEAALPDWSWADWTR